MITATLSATDDAANYLLVACHRRGTTPAVPRAGALWPEVEQLYDAYSARVGDPSGPHRHDFAPLDQAILRDNAIYLSLAHFKDLRASILDSAGGRCASCNNVKASEVDHYLPKEHFGEYAIFSRNLTPICTPCNKKKLDRYRRQSGGRRYIHPYLDILPDHQIIQCAVSVGASVTTKFFLDVPSATPPDISSMMNQHFEDLGLAIMYGEEATNEMQARLGSLYGYFQSGDTFEVQKYLLRDGASAARHYGRNHWQPVTLTALAQSTDFCNGGFKALGPDPLM